MSLYIYCPRPSQGALDLTKALGAKRLRRFDGMDFWNKKDRFKLTEGDSIICWGASVPELEGVTVLNALDTPLNKKDELSKLLEAGVPTVTVYGRTDPVKDKVEALPRKVSHRGGADLLLTPKVPDYYVLKESLVTEYRIHSFRGASIRAGVKVPREGFTPVDEANWKPESSLVHPWIRSFDAGWRVNYTGFTSTAKMRNLAHKSVAALGLTFGAVDLGLREDGKLLVLEVNRAPGIEGGSVQAYVRAVNKWLEAQHDVRGDEEGREEPGQHPF